MFPAKNYDIDNFPAVKRHLLTFGKEILLGAKYDWVANDYLEEWCYKRLEQTGKEIVINGEKIKIKNNEKSRKATNNKWFETQDSISYWEDFSKQKIVWLELTDHPNFCLDTSGYFINNTVFFITGEYLPYILSFLNSKLCEWYFTKIAATSGAGTRRWIKLYIDQICIPQNIEDTVKKDLGDLALQIQKLKYTKAETIDLENQLDEKIFNLFDLSKEEIATIDDIVNTL